MRRSLLARGEVLASGQKERQRGVRVCAYPGNLFLPRDAESLHLHIHGLTCCLQPHVCGAAPSPSWRGDCHLPHKAAAVTVLPISEEGRTQAKGPGI